MPARARIREKRADGRDRVDRRRRSNAATPSAVTTAIRVINAAAVRKSQARIAFSGRKWMFDNVPTCARGWRACRRTSSPRLTGAWPMSGMRAAAAASIILE